MATRSWEDHMIRKAQLDRLQCQLLRERVDEPELNAAIEADMARLTPKEVDRFLREFAVEEGLS
jgi:hypothetical protein